jgi:serine/threonine-protein kinase
VGEPVTPTTTGDYLHVCGIAEGGMGTVEVALRMEGRFRRLYAIKRLRPHLSAEPEILKMFLDEARIAGLLRHPNIVSVLDVGEDERGPFLVMDFVEGVTLGALIQAAGRLPLQVAVRIALETARGLHAAHELVDHDGSPLALVHRDVSPSNILVSYDGDVRISDFGIAKALGRTTRTSTGVLKGKMAYMSPEQLRFEEPDRRSDLFALGVVLFEMLSGKRLYHDRGDGNEGVRRILNEPPPDIGEIRPATPPALVELSMELLSKNRDERPQTAAEVAERLERILSEMLVAEPRIDLGAFSSDVFGEELDARRRELAAAVDAAEASGGTVELAAPKVMEVPTVSSRKRGNGVAFAGVVGLVLTLGLVGGWLLGRTSEPATSEDVVEAPAPIPPAASQDETVSTEEASVSPSETTPPMVEDADDDGERPRPRLRMQRSRPRTMRQASEMGTMEGLGIWEDFDRP